MYAAVDKDADKKFKSQRLRIAVLHAQGAYKLKTAIEPAPTASKRQNYKLGPRRGQWS